MEKHSKKEEFQCKEDRQKELILIPNAYPLPNPPSQCGYLMKLKRKTSILSSWNKRWFAIDQKKRELTYYKNEQSRIPTGAIHLDDIKAVVVFDDTQFQVESSYRNFFLCGETKEISASWVACLEKYRMEMVKYEKSIHSTPIKPSPTTFPSISPIPISSQDIPECLTSNLQESEKEQEDQGIFYKSQQLLKPNLTISYTPITKQGSNVSSTLTVDDLNDEDIETIDIEEETTKTKISHRQQGY